MDRSSFEQHGFALFPGAVPDTALPSGLPGHSLCDVLDHETCGPLASGMLNDIATAVLGRAAFPVRANLFVKTPEHNWPVAWHQDRVVQVAERAETPGFDAWSTKNGRHCANASIEVLSEMVALRLHLEACENGDGALHVLPGSQNQIWTPDRIRELPEGRTQRRETPLLAAKGDVWALRPLLLHRSGRLTGTRPRPVLHVEYATEPLPAPLRWAVRA